MQNSSLLRRYAPKGALMFVIFAVAMGALLVSAPPQFSSRSTISVSGTASLPTGMPSFASFLTKDTTEDYLAGLESQSLRQRAADTLNLACKPVPDWQPNPLFYQISRILSLLFKTKAPLDYTELAYPSVTTLNMDFARVKRAKFAIELDGKGKYTLLSKGRVVDTKPVGQPLSTGGFEVALDGFTPDKAQRWKLALTDPAEITTEMRNTITVFRVGLRSNTIGVSCTEAHPKLAAKVVNTIIEHFIQRDIEGTQQISQDSISYIDRQIEQIEGEIAALQSQQEDLLSDRSSLLASAARMPAAQGLLAQKESLGTLQTEHSNLSALIDNIDSDEEYIGYYDSGILNRPIEVELVQDILETEKRLKTELLVKTENHPDVIRERVRLKSLRDNLINLLDESRSQLSKDISSVRKKIGEYELLLDLSPAVEVELKKIETDLTIRSQTLGTLYAQQQVANLQKISNTSPIRILDAGVPQNRPVSPRIMMVALGSILFSLLFTAALLIFMSAFDKSIFGENDLTSKFGAPVIAVIGPDGKADGVNSARLLSSLRSLAAKSERSVIFAGASPDMGVVLDSLRSAAKSVSPDIGGKFRIVERERIEELYGEGHAGGTAIIVTPCGARQRVAVSRLVAEADKAGLSLAAFVLIADAGRSSAGAARRKPVESKAG